MSAPIKGDDVVLLSISDLKKAFKNYCLARNIPRNEHVVEWNRFYYEIKDKATVVPRDNEPFRIKPGDSDV